ncbi:MAG: recombinase family protein, partial [Oscillospiraceae bacterium]|nr:recombinase family protein [Oscillospiraceae bacterium]
ARRQRQMCIRDRVKTYDPNNEFDEEYFEFGLFMSRREYKTINRRMQRGRIASAKEGKYLGSATPYGYKKAPVPNGKGFMLVPHEDEADVVKLIFELYLQGKGTPLIARELDKLGIKPRHKEYWSRATIQDIIKNPVYIGKIRWSYRPDKVVRNGQELVKVRYQNPDCIFVDGLHEPLISQDVFDKAQAIRMSNKRPRVKNDMELQNPLSGLMFCGKCGSSMTRMMSLKKGRPYEAIMCTNRYCDCVSAPIFLVEQKLLRILAEWLEKYKISNKNDEEKINTEAENKMLEKLKRETEKIENQILSAYDLVEQKVYTPEVFTQRVKILTDKKAELTAQYDEIQNKIKSMQNKAKKNLEIIPAIENVLQQYNDLSSATEKNVLLKSVLNKIDYIKDTPNRKGHLLNDNFSLTVFPKV